MNTSFRIVSFSLFFFITCTRNKTFSEEIEERGSEITTPTPFWRRHFPSVCSQSGFFDTITYSFALSIEVSVVTGLLSFRCWARQIPPHSHLILSTIIKQYPKHQITSHCIFYKKNYSTTIWIIFSPNDRNENIGLCKAQHHIVRTCMMSPLRVLSVSFARPSYTAHTRALYPQFY